MTLDCPQPADPRLKRYDGDPHTREDSFTALAVIFNQFNFRDPQFDMPFRLGTPISILGDPNLDCKINVNLTLRREQTEPNGYYG